MTENSTTQIDLARLFSSVSRTLKKNQLSLNAADEYNHNHGDNMVKNFQVITQAVRAKKESQPAEQLSYAAELLNKRSQSDSAQLYAQGLTQAASRFQGKPAVTQDDAMLLVQSLLGGQAAPGGMGGGQPGAVQGQQAGGDLLGGLLGALMGGTTAAQPAQTAQESGAGGIDLNMLLTAGMSFFQARQSGAAPLDALVQAVMAGSQMQSSAHHSQSGQLVAETLLKTVGSMLSGKK